jgi:outer membrane protein assembly factor BamB
VATGTGSVHSYKHPYDDSDAVLEISPSLHLLQYFAPANWAVNNADDLGLTAEPVLLSDGQVILAGKSQVVYLLNGKDLGGIGTQQAELNPACTTNIDGGSAHVGMTVYLPCLTGIIAVKAASSPPALHMLWSSGIGGGPPIVAGGLVWTIGQNGELYGLDPATGKVRQQANIGTPANHFPTPGIGAGLLLAPSARDVVAFRASSAGGTSSAPPGPGDGRTITVIVLASLVVIAASGWLVRLIRRQRQA